MTPSVWRRGCPVAPSALRHVSLPYVGFDGRAHRGALVVHHSAATDVVTAFRAALPGALPDPADAADPGVRRRRLREHRGRQHLGLQLPRRRPGRRSWSEHAYGRAIDINPIENPYVSGGRTSHRASVPYLDRSTARPGMAVEGGVLVARLRRRRLGLGRPLERDQGLPALLRLGALRPPCPRRVLRVAPAAAALAEGFDRIRRGDAGSRRAHPPDALAEAGGRRRPRPRARRARRPARPADLVTIDPPGSRDLDQAVAVERRGDGFRVRYAIADVAAFVVAGRRPGRGGARARRHRLHARPPLPAPPRRARRGRRQPAARAGARGAALDGRPRRGGPRGRR